MPGGLSAQTVGTMGVRVGLEIAKSLILMVLAQISPLSPHRAPCLPGRHLPPEPVHSRELTPCLPPRGRSSSMMEDFRSSTSPKATTAPLSKFSGVQPPAGRPPGSRRPGTLRDRARAPEPRAPRGMPGRFTAEVPAQIFITALSCFTARAQPSPSPVLPLPPLPHFL